MQITLTSKEFDEAVSLWLKEQGFTTDRYDIATRVIVGRGDSGAGTRVEVTLEPRLILDKAPLKERLSAMDIQIATGIATSTKDYGKSIEMDLSDTALADTEVSKKISTQMRRFGQGHSDE